MKNILFVNSCLSGGGSERVMTLLANQFCQMGYNVTMVLLREKRKSYNVSENVKLVEFHYVARNKVGIALQRIVNLRKLMKYGNFDVVVSFMYDINLTTLIAGLGMDIPIFISERNDPQNRKTWKIYEIIEKFFYNKAAGLVLQTNLVKEYYSKKVKIPLRVIPNPIKVEKKPYYGKREKRIVAVGRLREQKNFSMLLVAFEEFNRKYQDYTLDIFGEGPLKEDLLKLSHELGIENKVNFRGYVDNILDCIRSASIYVSSSNYEGISNSMLEAMAMGIPTICTDCPVGGAAFVIENGVNGILIPLNNKEYLVNNLLELATNIELRRRLSVEAIKVRERFSMDNIVEEWIEFFELLS